MALFDAIRAVLGGAWSLLTSTVIPGTSITVAAAMLGSLCAVSSLRLIGNLGGFSFSHDQRGGNNRRIQISKNRSGDQF